MEMMTRPFGSVRRYLILGAGALVYWLLLAAIGLGAANGEDGTMIPLYIFSSPPVAPLLIFAPIVLWPIVSLILSRAGQSTFKKWLLFLMAIHYIGIMPYLMILGDWDHLSQLIYRSPFFVFILATSYLGGQSAVWFLYAATQHVVGPELESRVV